MQFNRTEKEEKAWLQQIINLLKQRISHTDKAVREHIDTLQEYKIIYLWSNKDMNPHEIRSMRESILNHYAVGENVIDTRRRLGRTLHIPYFGRIDFQEKRHSRPVPVYIGTRTFYDPANKMNLIYDWRAPIAGMIQKVFVTGEIMKLCKSYRSTFEITELAQRNHHHLGAHGERAGIRRSDRTAERYRKLLLGN